MRGEQSVEDGDVLVATAVKVSEGDDGAKKWGVCATTETDSWERLGIQHQGLPGYGSIPTRLQPESWPAAGYSDHALLADQWNQALQNLARLRAIPV